MVHSLISVVMPVRNGGSFLVSAIASISKQPFRDFKFIIVDDGSIDGSAAILFRAAEDDDRIELSTQASLGIVFALNRGIRATRSPIIAVMHADDVAIPDRLERQLATLETHPEAAVVGTGIEMIDPDGIPRGTWIGHPTGAAEIRAELLEGNVIAHPTVMMRREAVLAVGLYRPLFRAAEDYDLWLRLSERYDLLNLPDVLLQYREHPGQISARMAGLQRLEALLAQRCALARRSGRQDPIGSVECIDRALLHRAGIADAEIAAHGGDALPCYS